MKSMFLGTFRLIIIVFCFIIDEKNAVAQENEDYLGHSFYIIEYTFFDVLVENQAKFDSLDVLWDNDLFIRINGITQYYYSLSDEYVIEYRMNKKKIALISTKYLTAKFRYGFGRKLKKIKFDYSDLVDHFDEGTIVKVKFNWVGGKLESVKLIEHWGVSDISIDYYSN